MNESQAGGSLADGAPAPVARVELPFEFRGDGGEYFRIWIVNLLLTIVTLGIYSAWAKVRRLRYFYGNTFVDGQSFEYHGQPLAILKGRLIVVAAYFVMWLGLQVDPRVVFLLLPVALFGVPWIIMRARRFQMRMTSYRNLRFDFHGTYGGALGAFVGWYFLAVLTLGILFPFWVRKRVAYTLDNMAYGQQAFSFHTRTGEFYKFCLITLVLSLCVYFGVIYTIFSLPDVAPLMRGNPPPSQLELAMAFGVKGWIIILAGVAVGMGITAYYQASFLNASFGGIQCGSQWMKSRLRVAPLAGIYLTNLFGILFTLGLYYPWAKVRMVRYQLERMAVDSDGNLAAFTASAGANTNVVAEEAGDFLDVDFGI